MSTPVKDSPILISPDLDMVVDLLSQESAQIDSNLQIPDIVMDPASDGSIMSSSPIVNFINVC